MTTQKKSVPRAAVVGRPARKQIATLCASCHSKLDYMRRYNPQARVDQYTEYLTSVHGKKYVAGDTSVATCIDCHGAHGVRAVKDPNGQVYATNVAATCKAARGQLTPLCCGPHRTISGQCHK